MGPILLGLTASNSYLAGGNSGEKVKCLGVQILVTRKVVLILKWSYFWGGLISGL